MLVPFPGSARLLFASWFALPDDCVQGGTINVFTLLLLGSTSWFGCDAPLDDELDCAPELCCEVPAPPGVSRIVLDGGDGGVAPEPDEAPLPWHGCTATVSVCAFLGTMIMFDPGGGFVLPVLTAEAWSQVGITIVRSWRWRGITTWRTPGVCSAVETGSPDELLEELLLLPPHAATPSATATTAPAEHTPRTIEPPVTDIRFPLFRPVPADRPPLAGSYPRTGRA
jgi:hypothetical protein